jgi:hypothetical protein
MLSKFALALVVSLGAVSAASAASQHAIQHHRTVAQHRAPAAAYKSYGFAGSGTVRTGSPGLSPEDRGAYDPYNHQQVKCIGGSCSPEWGLDSNE